MIAEDGITVVGKVCHIEAASSKGPRYRSEMSDDERRSYNNLILLCDEHHSIIDNKKNEGKFLKELLLEWKTDHIKENENSEIEVADDVIYESIENIIEALDRLEKSNEKIYATVKEIDENLKNITGVTDLNQMKSLVEDYKKEVASGESEFKELFDKIRHFSSNIDDIKQELPEKLIDGGFNEDIDWATELKEAYSMRLLKNDVSLAQQKIHAFLLVKIQMSFRRHVLSAIRKGNNKDQIRALIDNEVISKVGSYLGYDNVLDLYEDDLNGMLYFLTGNCHIKWV
ncbi:ABC-three component system protein [Aquimarina muelleri]|uniref:ABC-three component system protein n=1 Tax=Aquimarina muelleri TaxID=279356 RepID=UPI003F68478C